VRDLVLTICFINVFYFHFVSIDILKAILLSQPPNYPWQCPMLKKFLYFIKFLLVLVSTCIYETHHIEWSIWSHFFGISWMDDVVLVYSHAV